MSRINDDPAPKPSPKKLKAHNSEKAGSNAAENNAPANVASSTPKPSILNTQRYQSQPMPAANTLEWFLDERSEVPAKRIQKANEQIIYQNYDDYVNAAIARAKARAISQNKALTLADVAQELHRTQEEYAATKFFGIVEHPCRAIAATLINAGHRTTSSNAYGAGRKGITWIHSETGKKYFTNLRGQNYDAETSEMVSFKELAQAGEDLGSRVKEAAPKLENFQASNKDLDFYLNPRSNLFSKAINNGHQALYPNYDDYKAAHAQRLVYGPAIESPEQYHKYFWQEALPEFLNRAIEKPCHKMMRALFKAGKYPYMSNAFSQWGTAFETAGDASKGIIWQDEAKSNTQYFTYLKDGKTINAQTGEPVEVEPHLENALKESIPDLDEFLSSPVNGLYLRNNYGIDSIKEAADEVQSQITKPLAPYLKDDFHINSRRINPSSQGNALHESYEDYLLEIFQKVILDSMNFENPQNPREDEIKTLIKDYLTTTQSDFEQTRFFNIIEQPCRAICEVLSDAGMKPHWSNAFGAVRKGVHWTNPFDNDKSYFTRLDGFTFEDDARAELTDEDLNNRIRAAVPSPEDFETNKDLEFFLNPTYSNEFKILQKDGLIFDGNNNFKDEGSKDLFLRENIERPCRAFAKALIASGKIIHSTNSFGEGIKGISWANSEKPNELFFTDLRGSTKNKDELEAKIDPGLEAKFAEAANELKPNDFVMAQIQDSKYLDRLFDFYLQIKAQHESSRPNAD